MPRLSEVFGVSADYRECIEVLETLPEPQRNHLVEFLDALIAAHEATRKL